jgi:hypothetical protein
MVPVYPNIVYRRERAFRYNTTLEQVFYSYLIFLTPTAKAMVVSKNNPEGIIPMTTAAAVLIASE